MNGSDANSNSRTNPAGFQAIFGYVLLGISLFGIILTLTVPWFNYEYSMEYEGEAGTEVGVTHSGSYTYSELGEETSGERTYASESKYMERGARYVLWGFILLTVMSGLYLLGLFIRSFKRSAAMLALGVDGMNDLNCGHMRSLKMIAVLSMWVPAAMVAYGSSRFIGYTRALSTNISESSGSPFYGVLTGDYGTPAGYIMFITGMLILGGLSFFLIRFWLKPLLSHSSGRGGITSATKGAIMLFVLAALLTVGYGFMPMFSIITSEEHMELGEDTYHFEFCITEGGIHDSIDLMEEEGVMVLIWEDIGTDLSMMQWALFTGMLLSVISLMGLAMTLSSPRYALGLLMQNGVYLVFVAAIVFLIGQSMLWADIPDLTSHVSTSSMEYHVERSYGNNYLPFLTCLLAIPAAVMGCIYLTPYSLQIMRSKEYAGRGAYSGTGAHTEMIPITPSVGGGFPVLFRKHRTPIIAGSGIVTLIVVGILIYAFVDFGEEPGPGDEENVVEFNAGDFDLVGGDPLFLQDYAQEGAEYAFVHEINDANVESVYFLLTWVDEDDTGWIGPSPNHENEPDHFTISVESPTGELVFSKSGSNAYGQEGIVEFTVPVPISTIPAFNGTGGWNITLTVEAGDHEPTRIGIFKFLDNGNDFTLTILHEYYVLKNQ